MKEIALALLVLVPVSLAMFATPPDPPKGGQPPARPTDHRQRVEGVQCLDCHEHVIAANPQVRPE